MITETITRIKLTASEGMMLTDGEHYGKEVFLAEDADAGAWHEITQEEYDELMGVQEYDELMGEQEKESVLSEDIH